MVCLGCIRPCTAAAYDHGQPQKRAQARQCFGAGRASMSARCPARGPDQVRRAPHYCCCCHRGGTLSASLGFPVATVAGCSAASCMSATAAAESPQPPVQTFAFSQMGILEHPKPVQAAKAAGSYASAWARQTAWLLCEDISTVSKLDGVYFMVQVAHPALNLRTRGSNIIFPAIWDDASSHIWLRRYHVWKSSCQMQYS